VDGEDSDKRDGGVAQRVPAEGSDGDTAQHDDQPRKRIQNRVNSTPGGSPETQPDQIAPRAGRKDHSQVEPTILRVELSSLDRKDLL